MYTIPLRTNLTITCALNYLSWLCTEEVKKQAYAMIQCDFWLLESQLLFSCFWLSHSLHPSFPWLPLGIPLTLHLPWVQCIFIMTSLAEVYNHRVTSLPSPQPPFLWFLMKWFQFEGVSAWRPNVILLVAFQKITLRTHAWCRWSLEQQSIYRNFRPTK